MKSVKPLFLICGGFMAAASLMGTIDYSKASKSGDLKNLYKDEKAPLAAIPFFNTEQSIPPPPPAVGSFSRAPLRYAANPELKEDAVPDNAYREKSLTPKYEQARRGLAATILNGKKMRVAREITLKSFSRAALPKVATDKMNDEEVPNDK